MKQLSICLRMHYLFHQVIMSLLLNTHRWICVTFGGITSSFLLKRGMGLIFIMISFNVCELAYFLGKLIICLAGVKFFRT